VISSRSHARSATVKLPDQKAHGEHIGSACSASAPSAWEASNKGAEHKQSGDHHDLSLQGNARDVDRRLPADLSVTDHIDPDRTCVNSEAAAPTGGAALLRLTAPASSTPASTDAGNGDDKGSVSLDGIAEDLTHSESVTRRAEDLIRVHRHTSVSRGSAS
jgi:hypothetical protein